MAQVCVYWSVCMYLTRSVQVLVMIVKALGFQTDRELLVNVTFASADRFDVCLLQDRGCDTSPTLEPTSRFRIPPLGKNSPLPICLALLELTIADLLFTRSDTLFASGIQDYLHVADYNISYIITQCATERIGRNMTLTKPPERTSLGDENFKMLVWISYNCPPIHQVDFSKYVDVWLKEKHQLALFQSGGEQRVLERKSRERKHTVFM